VFSTVIIKTIVALLRPSHYLKYLLLDTCIVTVYKLAMFYINQLMM